MKAPQDGADDQNASDPSALGSKKMNSVPAIDWCEFQ
jgi:hypothetical protein